MMKKLNLIVLFTVLVSGIAFAQQKAEMSFKRTEHNFGIIKEEIGSVSTQFEFTNTGKSPLIIQRISASCGCATPGYTEEPVLPGKTGTISATYTTTRHPGTFNKTFKVFTNVPDTVYVLTIKGNVTPKQ
ncbi:MAG: DUF1573 domain-containing protein [Proteiniphilum sp.]|jgi:hypothetical protein|nr:DUF1573 domain-containing protein [Proteiniphilum sp.]